MKHTKEGSGSAFWIMKSEPTDFSITDLKKVKREPWTGVRNFQVRNMMRDQMKIGDKAFMYHSNCKDIGIVGEMRIVREAYPDPLQFDSQSKYYDARSTKDKPLWLCVDVEYIGTLSKIISLSELRSLSTMHNSPLLAKGNRLSVVPIEKAQYLQIQNVVT